MNKNNIDLELYSYARAQDNNDEHILEWINSNVKQSTINEQVHMDFGHEVTSMDVGDFKQEQLDEYYPNNPKHDNGLKDVIKINEEKTANIIVYNGVTGSFLDNFTRKGKHLNFYGFKRDIISMEAVLKTIYLENPNTQVYVCGIPNLLNINLVELINSDIRKICKLYPNVTYVESAPARLVYGKDGKIVFDIHYSKHEYLHLNNNIINSINKNYTKNKLFIEFDQEMKKYSNEGQFKNHEIKDDEQLITKIIAKLMNKYKNILDSNTIKELITYYKERYPHDYFYTPKKAAINALNDIKNSSKLK